MNYEAKPLPFSKPLVGISDKTLAIHHDKLYVGYVNKRNEIEEKLSKVDRTAANGTYSEYGELKRQETFATNAIYLHEYYFNILGGDGAQAGELLEGITKDFGSFENWLTDMKAAGMVARGWVVLAYDFNTGRLHNYVCDGHNQGGIWGAMPVIVLDTYEHAYFIDYGSDRKTYIEDYFKNLDWNKANEIFKNIKK
jgi:Fe-Mn family superoxide dismutase